MRDVYLNRRFDTNRVKSNYCYRTDTYKLSREEKKTKRNRYWRVESTRYCNELMNKDRRI